MSFALHAYRDILRHLGYFLLSGIRIQMLQDKWQEYMFKRIYFCTVSRIWTFLYLNRFHSFLLHLERTENDLVSIYIRLLT